MKRKQRDDSITSAVKQRQDIERSAPVPDGIVINDAESQALWDQYTSARDIDTWRQIDLLLIGKIVHKEMDIRRHKAMLDRTSVLIENKRGTMVVNPLISVIDTYERMQLAIIRSLSLGVHAGEARGMNNGGQRALDKVDHAQIKSGNVVSLLA